VNFTIRPQRDDDHWPARRASHWPIADLPMSAPESTLIAQSADGPILGGMELSHVDSTAILRGYCSDPNITPGLLHAAENWAKPLDCTDWVGLLSDELNVHWATRRVTDPRAGGIDLFLGTTRRQTHEDGRELTSLDYEAYPDMALARMQKLLADARGQWPIVRSVLLHRVGRVALGESSVLIAVSCPHRAEAFAACRWLIDTLKVDVPIWKQERWSDGGGTWVQPPPPPQSR
jgi:molybdopterin synthase catalytic subunit